MRNGHQLLRKVLMSGAQWVISFVLKNKIRIYNKVHFICNTLKPTVLASDLEQFINGTTFIIVTSRSFDFANI